MKQYDTGIGTNEMEQYFNGTVCIRVLFWFITLSILLWIVMFRILNNSLWLKTSQFTVVSIIKSTFKEWNGMIWYFKKWHRTSSGTS